VAGIGFQNALGALAPPEVAVHLEWNGRIRVNGAKCGGFQIAASRMDADQQPDWLCIGLDIPLWPAHEEMGETPDETALYAEGCSEVDAANLIEAWARHTLNWITRWDGEGVKPVHDEWRGLVHGIGEDIDIDGKVGTFLGVDENFGLLLRTGDETTLIPLTKLLKD
jgi:BirA family biotin operon repressor/biotin-[acetyl-CoA-carboxylase] ligase